VYYRGPGWGGSGAGAISVQDLRLLAHTGIGLLAVDTQRLRLEGIDVLGSMTGFSLENNCYEVYCRALSAVGDRFGLRAVGNVSVGKFDGVRVAHARNGVGLMLVDAYGVEVSNFYGVACRAFCVVKGDAVDCELSGSYGDEASEPPDYGVVLCGVNNVLLRRLNSWLHGRCPSLTVAGGRQVAMTGCNFRHELLGPAITIPQAPAVPVLSFGTTLAGQAWLTDRPECVREV
jgi:hypothetical protein